MSESDFMNQVLRQRSTPSFGPDASNASINRAIREAAGYTVPPDQPESQPRQRTSSSGGTDPRSASRKLLGIAAKHVLDSEPVAGVDTGNDHDQWLWSRPVVDLLDQEGRLPGEAHYNPSSTSHILGAEWDVEAAHAARRHRWQAMSRM